MSKKINPTRSSAPAKTHAPKAPQRAAPPKAKHEPQPRPWMTWVLAGIIAVATFVVYSNASSFEFTNWDDPTYVTENPLMSKEHVNTNEIFKTPVSLNYHPITMLTLAWNYQSAGVESASVYHSWNVWIHVFNTLLVFAFILMLSNSAWAAAFASAVFGLHPMHVESVAWISERKDVLYTFFFLLSCIAYLRFRSTRRWLWYGVCSVFFVLSVLSKAMAVVLPLALVLIDYLLDKKINFKKQLDKLPLLAFSLAMGFKAYSIQAHGAVADAKVFTLFQRLMFGSYGAAVYLVKFFYPFGLSAFYPYPTLNAGGSIPFYFYLAPLVWLVIGGLMYWSYKKFPPLAFGLAWFVLTVALVLQFLSVGTAIMADRYSYVPYIGIAFAVVMLLERAVRNKSSYKISTMALCGLFCAVLAVQAKSRVNVWKNSDTLWSDVIEKYPGQVEVAYKNRGNYWGKEHGDAQKAYENYSVLKHMHSHDSRVYSNMGNVYAMRQQADSALWAYNTALQMDPKNEEAYINRGITYSIGKQYDKALDDFKHAEAITGLNASLAMNMAYTELLSGKYDDAVQHYNYLIAHDPNNGQAYANRAVAEEQLGQRTQALQDVRQAQVMGVKVDAGLQQRLGG